MGKVKLTKEEIAYYKKGCKAMTSAELKQVDSERTESIVSQGTMTVVNKVQKSKRSDFKNDAEYNYYLLCVYDAADRAENGLL